MSCALDTVRCEQHAPEYDRHIMQPPADIDFHRLFGQFVVLHTPIGLRIAQRL